MRYLLFFALLLPLRADQVTIDWEQSGASVLSWRVSWAPTTVPGQAPTPQTNAITPSHPYTITNLTAGAMYTLEVRAISTNGLESTPATIRHTIPLPPPEPPPSPTNVRVVSLAPDGPELMRLAIAWGHTNDIGRYAVAFTNASEPTGLSLQSIYPRAEVPGLVPGARYNLGVTALDANGLPSESVPIKLTPASNLPGLVAYTARVGTPMVPPLPSSMPARTARTMRVLQGAVTEPAFIAISEGAVVVPLALGTNQILSIINGKAYVVGQ